MTSPFDQRPIIVAIAGPNGAGKTTFFHAHLAAAGLRFVNADDLARELEIDAAEAAELAGALRASLVAQRESFVFETVFSDPVGDKVDFLRGAASDGYTVVLCYIGLASAEQSDERVAMRVMQGGHDVPPDRIAARFPRSLANLARAVATLPHVLVYDNSDLSRPYRLVAEYEGGVTVRVLDPPAWLAQAAGRTPASR
jgi:predicted ABC-type ATPase